MAILGTSCNQRFQITWVAVRKYPNRKPEILKEVRDAERTRLEFRLERRNDATFLHCIPAKLFDSGVLLVDHRWVNRL